ncbi:MAG: hypothetical protein GAKPKEKM_02593 [Rhodocyclaceae bacterium]|nr:hypothetical protein [Rhodocyclaceae bacterium]
MAVGAGAYFDHNADGFAESTGWVGSDDGLLVFDHDGNGRIDSGRELFGSETLLANGEQAANGFEALTEYDINADGLINDQDVVWANLKVWRDLDGDGYSASNELLSLSDAGVASISTGYTNSSLVDTAGNEHRQVGNYTRTDGTTGTATDVWFQRNSLQTIPLEWVEVPADIQLLPNATGTGTVFDLHQAMARDGTGALQSLVTQFVGETDFLGRSRLVQEILFHWADADAVDPASRGGWYFDARRLVTLERFAGRDYQGTWFGGETTPDANGRADGFLNEAFLQLQERVYAELMMQSHLQELYGTLLYTWDAQLERVRVDLGEFTTALQALSIQNPALAKEQLSEFVRTIRGFGYSDETLSIEDIRQSVASLGAEYQQVVDQAISFDVFVGTVGDDRHHGGNSARATQIDPNGNPLSIEGVVRPFLAYGGNGGDFLNGGDLDDILLGEAGNDTIIGEAGNDNIDGGTGDDTLDGRDGDDVYVFNIGFGQDLLYEFVESAGTNDVVRFDSGILSSDIEVGQEAITDMSIRVRSTGDRITFWQWYGGHAETVEQFEFSDGTIWNAHELTLRGLLGTSLNDYIYGTVADDVIGGKVGDDYLAGEGGADTLLGEDGNDSLRGGAGADTLDGGAGNDAQEGGDGADTYLFVRGFGHDTIYEYDAGSGGNDIVRFAADILPAEVELSRNDSDLFLEVPGTEDRITVSGFFADPAQRIERVEFADGTVWDEAMLASAKYLGTEGSDFITGTEAAERFETGAGNDYVYAIGGNDVVFGGAGNDGLSGDAGNDALYGEDGDDTLEGGDGSDTLDGGTGNDSLNGGDGADTYLFTRGFGHDTIYEYDAGSGGNDIVRFAADILPAEVELSRNESDLFLKVLGTEDRITVSGFYADPLQRIERVEFADGTAWTSSTLLAAKFVSTEDTDFIFGTTGNDRIEGRGGDDYLYGDAGADTLDGGSGNDQLDGGAGNDIYLFDRGYGQDTIYETSGSDTVRFATGITAADVFVWRDDSHYYFDLVGANDRLTVDNWYTGSTYRIENVEFADGTVWNSTILNAKTTTASEYADFYWGTASANTYDGLAGDDRIFGFGGNDTLRGGEGNDFIDGGIGNDVMIGGTGDDTYVVDSATDTVTELAGEGVDTVQATVTHTLAANVENLTLLDAGGAINGTGNELDNILIGNASANILAGGAGNDWIEGGAGNDTLDGGIGADVMIGGTGSDTYVVDDVGDVVIELAGQGTDTVQSSFSYVLGSNLEKLTLTGTAVIDGTGNELDNTLTGNGAANVLIGGAGDDSLNGGAGADTLIGGTGDDTYTVDNAGDIVTEHEGEGNDTVRSSINWTLGATLENLTLTGSANRVGTGNALDNVLTGNSGNNTLYGLAGNDWLDGGDGTDTLIGGTGDDTYVVDNAADVVTENAGEGTDTVQASFTYTLAANVENLILLEAGGAINGTGNALDNVISGNAANNTLNGGGGADTLIGGLGDDIYVVDTLDTVVENAGDGIDTVQAGFTYTLGANIETLTLTGSAAIDGYGNELDNTLTGNSAANVLAGGLGNDTYVIGATDTVVENAGEGADTVQASFSYALTANVENLTLTGSAAINATGNELDNTLTGNSGVNVLTGLAGNDWLDGKAGADTMIGGAGDDTYVVDNAGDVVTELVGEGIDTVRTNLTYTLGANIENLLLTGSSAVCGTGNELDNVLTGNSGVNILTGGAGNDTLDGKAGADTMIGGTGDDTYTVDNAGDVVTENAGEGNDTVVSSIAYTLGANLENLTLSGSSGIAGTGNADANIIVGNTGANTLWGRDGDDTLRGNGGADTLNGENGNDFLDGGSGNDTLVGGLGDDTYWLARGYGNDMIQENDATAGNTDVASFDTDIAVDQLWFRHVGNNLEVSIIGTSDKFTIQNWYSGSAYHVEQFRTADNQLLLDSQVENLVQAMAAFSPPAAGQTTLPQNYHDALSPVIAANWQ